MLVIAFFYIVGEGTYSANPMNTDGADLPVVPQTLEDASFKLAPSPTLLKEQKNCVKIMLLGITQRQFEPII